MKKPVHVAILKPTLIQKLKEQGRLSDRRFAGQTPDEFKLPVDETATKRRLPVLNMGSTLQKKALYKTQVRRLHESIPPLESDKIPPCDSCKTSACCRAFLVALTEEEYESGYYGDFAVKFSQEDIQQLQDKSTIFASLHAPVGLNNLLAKPDNDSHYYLEGVIGTACPFLQEDGRCGIYENRPVVCRVYSCVGDDRITQEMRDGSVDIEATILNTMLGTDNAE